MSHPKAQHTIPQFLLKGFTRGKKKQMFVYDKYTDKVFKSNISNISTHNKFYDFENEKEYLSIEESLSEIESLASKLIVIITKEKSIKDMEDNDRLVLSRFIAIQYLRVNQRRTEINDITKGIALWLADKGSDYRNVNSFKLFNEAEVKEVSIGNIISLSEKLMHLLYIKKWVLVETNRSYPFMISDNPLVKSNTVKSSFGQSHGFNSEGVEVIIPLNETLILHMYCPTMVEKIVKKMSGIDIMTYFKNDDEVMQLYNSFARDAVFKCDKDKVKWYNSMQISQSERWLYSPINDFELVKKMISKYPHIRLGPRIDVN